MEVTLSDPTIAYAASSGAPFRVGAVLNRTVEIFLAGFGRLFVLALLPMSPLLVITLVSGQLTPANLAAFSLLGVIALVLNIILGVVANAMILFGAFELMRGESFTIGQSLRVGLSRTLAVFGVSIVTGIAVVLGLVALIVPGIIILCMLYVAVPACVIEKLGVGKSLSRSSALTRGYRWPIFGIILLTIVGSAVVSYLVTRILGMIGGAIAVILFGFGWQVVTTAFSAVLSAVIYHDLRVAKEGVDVSKLANVFD